MQTSTKKTVVSNLIWRFAERSGAQGIHFIVSIILARLLSPSDYGTIGLITVFIQIANTFAESGLGQALVQKKNADNTDFSTVFFFSMPFSILIYAILFFCAPLISSFYEQEILTPVVRILGLSVFLSAINSVQNAYVQKRMQFKRFFWATLLGTILSAFVGIGMAYKGYGIWALVGQQLSMQIVNTVTLWITVKWRPNIAFSFEKMKGLFSYGWKILTVSLIDRTYNNIYSLVIGKTYSTTELGFYDKGKHYPLLVVQNINSAIESVLFPVLSKVQSEKERLKQMVRRSIMTSTYLIFPAMAGLAAVSEPLVKIMLTDKWLPCVPFMQFCCFTYAFWPVHTANLQAIKASGRSDITLKLEIIKKAVGIVILIITLPMGLIPMMYGRCVSTILSSFINAYPNKKLLGYSYWEQICDILPAFFLSIAMMVAVLLIKQLPINLYLLLLLQIFAGCSVYLIGSYLFKMESFTYLLNSIKGMKKNG